MRLTYSYDENRIDFTCYEYDKQNNTFILKNDEGDELEYSPILPVISGYDPKKYRILFFNNNATSENSIYEVHVKDASRKWKRVGWIFPIQALVSKEHTQVNNPYFLKYAYVGTCCLLDEINNVISADIPEEFLLDRFYDSNKSVLVLDIENCSEIEKFNIDDYVVGLYRYGYTYCGEEQPQEPLPQSTDEKAGVLKLPKLSDEIKNNSFIQLLFKQQLPKSDSPLIKFHFCYQIIEILISDIFDHKFSGIVNDITNDVEALFDVRDEIANISNEKYRVKLLFNKYSDNDTVSRNELNESCKELLSSLQRKTYDSAWENVYAVRCLLVHKLYTISTKEQLALLNRINGNLLVCVTKILFSYNWIE